MRRAACGAAGAGIRLGCSDFLTPSGALPKAARGRRFFGLRRGINGPFCNVCVSRCSTGPCCCVALGSLEIRNLLKQLKSLNLEPKVLDSLPDLRMCRRRHAASMARRIGTKSGKYRESYGMLAGQVEVVADRLLAFNIGRELLEPHLF